MAFVPNTEAVAPILRQLQKAVMRQGIQGTWKLERAAAWFDEVVEAGEPDAQTDREMVERLVDIAVERATPEARVAEGAHDIADLIMRGFRDNDEAPTYCEPAFRHALQLRRSAHSCGDATTQQGLLRPHAWLLTGDAHA